MKSAKEIGQVLKEARQKKGLTPDEIYKATRIQPHVVALLEQGRADEVLSRIYILSFLKKYAFFLDLDGSALAAEYKQIYTSEEKQVFGLNEESPAVSAETQKWMTFAIVTGIALLSIFFILFLGVRLRAARPARVSSKLKPAASPKAKAPKTKPPKTKSPKTKALFPIPNKKPIDLTLEGTGDVWMKVTKDGKKVFEGTLRKNEKKKISAKKKIELWVGRAEALEFTINGRLIGKVGKGNIKNIRITRRGLDIGKKRLFGAD